MGVAGDAGAVFSEAVGEVWSGGGILCGVIKGAVSNEADYIRPRYLNLESGHRRATTLCPLYSKLEFRLSMAPLHL